MKKSTLNPNPTLAQFAPIYRVQLVRESRQAYADIEQADDVVKLLSPYFETQDREHFLVVGLDAKHAVIGINCVSVGNLFSAIVDPADVFKAILLMNAYSVIVAHNHPSGDPTPSSEDFDVTRRLIQAGELLNRPLLDHIVFGYRSHVSIRRLDNIEGW